MGRRRGGPRRRRPRRGGRRRAALRGGAPARPPRRARHRAWASASSTTWRWRPSTCAATTAPARVAIFDFDVHHGNGTQHLFEDRADVFYASTHQYPFYPGTGAADERGIGEGRAPLNVPLPAGTGDEEYWEAIEGQILPALRRFAPEVLPLSAGFDAWKHDPLAACRSPKRVSGTGESGSAPRRRDLRRPDPRRSGRGYDLASLPRLVEAHLRGLEALSPSHGRRKPMIDLIQRRSL